MLITPHTLAGAAIGSVVPSAALAVPLSLGSHFVLDRVPHWQEILYPYKLTWKTWVRIPLDTMLAFLLVYLIAAANPGQGKIIWICACLAIFPDIDNIDYLFKLSNRNKYYKKYSHWHGRIQRETASVWGVLSQFTLSLVCLFFGITI